MIPSFNMGPLMHPNPYSLGCHFLMASPQLYLPALTPAVIMYSSWFTDISQQSHTLT